jgi:hypothetical protein
MCQYTVELRVCLYESYVKCGSARKVWEEDSRRKFPGITLPSTRGNHKSECYTNCAVNVRTQLWPVCDSSSRRLSLHVQQLPTRQTTARRLWKGCLVAVHRQHVRLALSHATFVSLVILRTKSTERTPNAKGEKNKNAPREVLKFLSKSFFWKTSTYFNCIKMCACTQTAFSGPLTMHVSYFIIFMERYLKRIGKSCTAWRRFMQFLPGARKWVSCNSVSTRTV